MFRDLLYLAAGAIFFAGCISVHETKHMPPEEPMVVAVAEEPAQVLRHVVLCKFKEGTTSRQIKDIEKAFCALPGRVDAIYDFEWGTDVSVEGHSQGYTHCFVVTFLSEADRAQYLPHPAHKELAGLLGPYLDGVLVVDYWTKP
jgi:hypothetical protein